MSATATAKPKEHGAWGVGLVSLLVGLLAAQRDGAASVPFPAALLLGGVFLGLLFLRAALFPLARYGAMLPAERQRAQKRLALWLALSAAVCGVPLLVVWKLFYLLPLGILTGGLMAFDLWLVRKRRERTTFGELLGVFALTLAAPAAHYATLGAWSAEAARLWLLCLAYFAGVVPYVKMHTARRMGKATRWWATLTLLYHLGVILGAFVLVWHRALPPLATVALMVALPRIFWALTVPGSSQDIRRIGWIEMVHAVVFGVLLIAAF
ncbi:MAG: YwiC-like family protein [Abditibacteriales bacterium]|nr:YwiC-like family protein [Abditibacteriales bacterium]MDW8365743.1 YwiC-like family protein [Abditibacteriales bacterium]